LTYAESHGWGTKDIKEIAKRLADIPKLNKKRDRVAFITQGKLPTIVAFSRKEINEYPVYEISKSEINDTNGAGDAFAGGFVAGLVESKPLAECVDMGQWLAGLSIRELRPSYPFPKQTYKLSASK
jgi:adenosine kinase